MIEIQTIESVIVPLPNMQRRNALTANVIGENCAIICNHFGNILNGNKLPLSKLIIPIITMDISLPRFTNIVKFAAIREREKKIKMQQNETKSSANIDSIEMETDLNAG